jgi:hypothetical protein
MLIRLNTGKDNDGYGGGNDDDDDGTK